MITGRLVKVIKVSLYCLLVYILYVRIRLIFSYSLDLEGGEFAFAHFVQVMLEGHRLYSNPNAYPYFVTMYGPIYPLLCYSICKLLNLNSLADLHTIYIVGRSLSLGAFVLILSVLYKFIGLMNQHKDIRALLALLLFYVADT